jgi:hypothetical protein
VIRHTEWDPITEKYAKYASAASEAISVYCDEIPQQMYGLVTGWPLRGRGLSPHESKILLFSTASRSALRSTQLPMHWVLGFVPKGVKLSGLDANHVTPTSTTHSIPLRGEVPLHLHVQCLSASVSGMKQNKPIERLSRPVN